MRALNIILLVASLCTCGCGIATLRFVHLTSPERPISQWASSEDFLQATTVVAKVAATENLVQKPYVRSNAGTQGIAFYVQYPRGPRALAEVLVWVYVSDSDGELTIEIIDVPEQMHVGKAVKIHLAFYNALVNHFGATRVRRERKHVKTDSWFGTIPSGKQGECESIANGLVTKPHEK